MVTDTLTEDQWQQFNNDGFVKLGKLMSDKELKTLQQRLHDLMMGNIQYDQLYMQLDPGGKYGTAGSKQNQTLGFKGATVNYRKIGEAGGGLECDPVFTEYMTKPIFRDICARVYGNNASISAYRAMVMNKPAEKGTELPWHQDGGTSWGLTMDPLITVWTAINKASIANGCVQVMRGTHKNGLMSEFGHLLSEENVEKYCTDDNLVSLELEEGESVLLHNWLVHRSGINTTPDPRCGFSVCYIDSNTRVSESGPQGGLGKPGQSFPILFECGNDPNQSNR